MVFTSFNVSNLQKAVKQLDELTVPAASLCTPDVEGRVRIEANNFVDVRAIHHGKNGVVYLSTRYAAKQAGAGTLAYGADGPVKVWVNGEAVGAQPAATNPAYPGEYQAAVQWTKGQNDIVFALATNGGRAWGIFAGVKK